MAFGASSSYLALGTRTPVYGPDGELIGVVKKVECDTNADIFDGLVLSTAQGDRYLLGEHVAAVHADAVEASVTAEQLTEVPSEPKLDHQGLLHHGAWHELRRRIGIRATHSDVEDPRLAEAEHRLKERKRAQELARKNPSLAIEAGVGRPDIAGAFHGGVVDINNISAEALAGLPEIGPRLAPRIVATRTQVGGFSSLEDMGLELDLSGEEVERLRSLVVCLPLQIAPPLEESDLESASGP